MILTIDNPEDEPQDYPLAIQAYMIVRAQNPNQEVGNGGAIGIDINNRPFTVVRNQDSYTVRVGEVIEGQAEEVTPPGFPI